MTDSLAATDWQWIGSPNPTVRFGGSSHRFAMLNALEWLAPEVAADLAILHAAEPLPDESYWAEFQSSDGALAVMWGGNEHNAHFLISSEPVEIVAPNQRTAPTGARSVVPYRMLEPLWKPANEALRDMLTGCREPSRVIVVGTPPPKSEAQIREHFNVEPGYAAAIASQGFTPDTAPICDIGTRVAAWQSLQESNARVAASLGATFLPVPDSARAPDGSLRPDLSTEDATHGNTHFGVVMWTEILRHLDEAR